MDITFYSHEQQDEFIFNLFGKDHKGIFLDIACCHPLQGNNTYTLESFCNWQGYCFDIIDAEHEFEWSSHRKSPFIKCDIGDDSFFQKLTEIANKTPIIDYASLDVDSKYTLLALEKIRQAGISLKSVTFEHEVYLYNEIYQKASVEILESMGLKRLFSNVKLIAANHTAPGRTNDSESFEDWWINPAFFPADILEFGADSNYYHHCIRKLNNFSKLHYNATHACSRAFPDEYFSYVWFPGEKESLAGILDFIRSNNLHR